MESIIHRKRRHHLARRNVADRPANMNHPSVDQVIYSLTFNRLSCFHLLERVNARNERLDSNDVDDEWQSEMMSSDDEMDSEESPSSNLVPQSTKNPITKKRSIKSAKPLPTPKRLRFTLDDNETTNETQVDPQQLLFYLKQTNSIVASLKKQQEQAAVSFDRSEQFLKILCSNQKKIAKAMIKRGVSGKTWWNAPVSFRVLLSFSTD